MIIASDDDWDSDRLNTDPGIPNGYIRFANGIHAYMVAGGGFEFEVSGRLGKIRTMDNGVLAQWRKVTEPWNMLEETPFPDVPRESGTVNAILDMVEALDNDRDTAGSIHLARRSQEIIFGLIESHRQGGARVALPLADRDLYVGRKDW